MNNLFNNLLLKIKADIKLSLSIVLPLLVFIEALLFFNILEKVKLGFFTSIFVLMTIIFILLLSVIMGLILFLFRPLLFQKIKIYIEDKLPILHHHAKEHYTRLNTYLINWHQEFKQADRPKKWQMVKKPILIIITILLLIRFGPLFTPPKIMTTFPGNLSSEAPLDSKIEIIFNKGVIKSFTEHSFNIIPNIPGSFSWESNQKLIFSPKSKLDRASSYQVSFIGPVLSSFLIPLIGNSTISFETLGNPKVVLASPQNEALEDLTPITVVFDRPMIALTTATNSTIRKPAFSITPEIKGDGRWLWTPPY